MHERWQTGEGEDGDEGEWQLGEKKKKNYDTLQLLNVTLFIISTVSTGCFLHLYFNKESCLDVLEEFVSSLVFTVRHLSKQSCVFKFGYLFNGFPSESFYV